MIPIIAPLIKENFLFLLEGLFELLLT